MELSYSLHLGNDKNKTKKARQTAKKTLSKTTSSSNNAIQNFQQLSKVNHHNLRQYDNNQEKIEIIKGSNNIVEDVKQLYLDLFEEARIEYNEKQNRNDRKIDNYFRHISDDDKHDLACEIIIELGDMFFWEDKELDYWKKMSNVFKNQISDLEELLPNFKIANATIHYDEHSPHLHIVGVAFKDGNKNGMKKQVGKSDVFNKTSLINIQDVMRNKCIKEFNYNYNLNATLRSKELGRNLDYSTDQMDYYKDLHQGGVPIIAMLKHSMGKKWTSERASMIT